MPEKPARNFHHFMPNTESYNYITYGSICDDKDDDTSVIEDKVARISPEKSKKMPSSEKSEKGDISENNTKNYTDDISNMEKFISQQSERHPKFYFAIGISIFILALLGLISCAYLGLNALRSFTKSYQPTTDTQSTFCSCYEDDNII